MFKIVGKMRYCPNAHRKIYVNQPKFHQEPKEQISLSTNWQTSSDPPRKVLKFISSINELKLTKVFLNQRGFQHLIIRKLRISFLLLEQDI